MSHERALGDAVGDADADITLDRVVRRTRIGGNMRQIQAKTRALAAPNGECARARRERRVAKALPRSQASPFGEIDCAKLRRSEHAHIADRRESSQIALENAFEAP